MLAFGKWVRVKPFYDLGDGDELVDTAIQMSGFRQVALRPSSADAASRLLKNGFVPICGALHVIASDGTLSRHRSRQRQLRAQTTEFDRIGLSISTLSGRRVLESRALFESIFYGLVVPNVYARGISPYGVQREADFARLVERSLVVAALDDGGNVRCASFYEVRDGRALTGGDSHALGRTIAVGLVEATDPVLSGCRRAWRHKAVQELSRYGFDAVSVGADDCMIDMGYVPVILDKLAWYRSVAWESRPRPRFVSLGVSRVGDRFPIVLSVQSDRLQILGRWGEHPAQLLRERLLSLIPAKMIGECNG